MNEFHFRPSISESVSKTVLISLAGTTGAGKTESGMRICRGIVGPKEKFAVIDTENKRALNKKSRYQPWDHLEFKSPYSPDRFKEAIDYTEKQGYKAILVDNFSHEWFGEGGCSDIMEESLEKMSRGDPQKAMSLSALAWKKPKQDHKKLMYRILQSNVPLIFCLRAEPKIKFQKDAQGKIQVVDAGWQPIAEKMFGYEMLVYILLMPDNPGVPVHLKKLEPEFESIFPIGKQLDEEAGRKIAEWANSGEAKTVIPESSIKEESDNPTPEEEQQTLKKAGMIPDEKPLMTPIEKFKSDLKIAKKSEIGKLFKEFVSDPSLSKEEIDKATNLVNQRYKELSKEK